MPASLSAALQGIIVLSISFSTKLSKEALVSFWVKCFGPVWSAVMKGRLTSVCEADDNSIFAFSAASFSL